MELYMMNRQHGRMIIESVENGPLIWPTIKENGVTRLRKYSELTHAKAIQADCDVKTTNITLQGLPPEVNKAQESDPEEDPKEYEDDESEDGLVDYPMDGGDDGDDDDGDSFGDEADDQDEDEEDEEDEEEEEHLASGDSVVVVPTFEPASISLSPKEEVERLLAMPTPPPSPLTSLSPPSIGVRLARCTALSAHSSPPPVPSSGCPTQIQTLRIASTHALIDAVTAVLPSLPLYIPPHVDRRDDIPETELPPYKKSCLFALGPSMRPGRVLMLDRSEVGYGIRDTWVDPAEAVPEIAPMTLGEVSRTHISHRVTIDSQRVDLLMEDRIAHHETILIVRRRPMLHERLDQYTSDTAIGAWYSYSDTTPEILRVIGDMRREMVDMKVELLALREQRRRARQPRSDARVPDHQDASRDTDSHIQWSIRIMAPMTRRGPNTPPNNINPKNMTPKSVQAMINQALLRNSTNGDRNHSSDGDNLRSVQTAPPCFYADFIKRQPLNFKITEGVVGLTQWIEWMESIFQISGCAIENQEILKKKMTKKYCRQGEIKKLEIELWNLKVKGNDVPTYTDRFQELTLICTKFVAN
nr:hypothetical protein [Tanacetum cinerariifolium]